MISSECKIFAVDALDDDPLFCNVEPYARLTVSSVDSQSPSWKRLLNKYDLREDSVRQERTTSNEQLFQVTLVKRGQTSGDHKKQALILFFTGIELAQKFPVCSIFLHEENRLYHRLAKAAGRPCKQTGARPQQSEFALDQHCAIYLRQAGIRLPYCDEGRLTLKREAIDEIRRELKAAMGMTVAA
jgi:hypothetical protein